MILLKTQVFSVNLVQQLEVCIHNENDGRWWKKTIYMVASASNQHTTHEFISKMRPSYATQLGYKLEGDPWLHLLVPLGPNVGLKMCYRQFSKELIASLCPWKHDLINIAILCHWGYTFFPPIHWQLQYSTSSRGSKLKGIAFAMCSHAGEPHQNYPYLDQRSCNPWC